MIMKRQIRLGTFETNSSSTHSLTMTDGETYNKWEAGEIWFNADSGDFLPVDEAIEWNIKQINELYLDDDEQLSDKFKNTYKEKKNLEETIEECEDDVLDWSDLKWESDLYKPHSEWEDYVYEGCYETFNDTYKTKNGDEVVAFGYYGYGG